MKTCRVCKEEKSLDLFYKKFKSKQSRTTICIPCTAIYYKKHNQKLNEKKRQSRENDAFKKYIHIHKSGYFLKTCKIHGNLDYSQIGLHQKLEKGDRSPTLYCLICKEIGREKRYNNNIKLERTIKKEKIICNSCKKSKDIPDFTESELKNKYAICRQCRHEGYVRHDENVSMMKGFKFTLFQYNDLLKKQDGVCAICKLPETQKQFGKVIRLAIDHCHKSSAKDHAIVRGLLCTNCNKGIGCFQDSSKNLRSAAIYLDKYYDKS